MHTITLAPLGKTARHLSLKSTTSLYMCECLTIRIEEGRVGRLTEVAKFRFAGREVGQEKTVDFSVNQTGCNNRSHEGEADHQFVTVSDTHEKGEIVGQAVGHHQEVAEQLLGETTVFLRQATCRVPSQAPCTQIATKNE